MARERKQASSNDAIAKRASKATRPRRVADHERNIVLVTGPAGGPEEMSVRDYTESVVRFLERSLPDRFAKLSASGARLPAPETVAVLIQAALPDPPAELDPHYADIGPFYGSDGAKRQLRLGERSKQALDSRRRNQTVLAMQTGAGTWLYPAWQFTGDGSIHPQLVPVLRAVRGMDRWMTGVWLVSDHPDLGGRSPRVALREGVPPEVVAELASRDRAELTGETDVPVPERGGGLGEPVRYIECPAPVEVPAVQPERA